MRQMLATATIAALTLLGAACSDSPLAQTGTGPSPTLLAGASGSERSTASYYVGVNSCPDGDILLGLSGNVSGQHVLLQWNEVGSIHEYVVAIERYDATNVYVPVGGSSVKAPLLKFYLQSEGRYRWHVRTQNDCGGYGPWSAWEFFSTNFNSDAPDAVVPPICVTSVYNPCSPPPCGYIPYSEGHSGYCDDEDNGRDNEHHDNPGRGGHSGGGGHH